MVIEHVGRLQHGPGKIKLILSQAEVIRVLFSQEKIINKNEKHTYRKNERNLY